MRTAGDALDGRRDPSREVTNITAREPPQAAARRSSDAEITTTSIQARPRSIDHAAIGPSLLLVVGANAFRIRADISATENGLNNTGYFSWIKPSLTTTSAL